MDLESFSQCLSYISTITKPSNSFEKILPVISTILGIVIGYILNNFRERQKESRTNEQKRKCISEDIDRLKSVAKKCIKESLYILDANIKGEIARGHSMPARAEPILVNEYFSQVAHTYSTEDREKILHMLDLASSLSERAAQSRLQHDDPRTEGMAAHNVLTHAVFCYCICEAILENKKPDYDQVHKIAEKYDFKSTYLDKQRREAPNDSPTQPA